MITARLKRTATTAVCAVGCLAQCGDDPQPEPGPTVPGAALEVAGVSIQRTAIEDYLPYFDTVDPRHGRKAKVREVLTQVLLPIAFQRRDFAAEREVLRERAAALQSVAQSYNELVERGAAFGGREPEEPYGRSTLPFPLARYAFDESNLGRTSEPIETGQGWALIAPRELLPGRTTAGDLCRAYVVLFHHQTNDDYDEWWRAARAAARDAVTWVDPDLRDALPIWLNP